MRKLLNQYLNELGNVDFLVVGLSSAFILPCFALFVKKNLSSSKKQDCAFAQS